MKIFGINFITKRELREEVCQLIFDNKALRCELEECKDGLEHRHAAFPFDLGQIVWDLVLKNTNGRYTKNTPSLEYSTITEVTVDEKNYFKLAERYKRNYVFTDFDTAEKYLRTICK